MRRIFFIIPAVLGLFLASTVFAVGGGGGGSVPSCTEDQWDCTGWSQCSAGGMQTRICTLTYDCSTSATPQPSESQSCAPPTPPAVTSTQVIPPSTPASAPAPKLETKPQPPVCARDIWICGEWSQSCNIYGREQRVCKLSTDCPNVETPPPLETQPCQKVQCGNKNTLRERIFCRLNLTPAGAARDLELQYLPEACRVRDEAEKKSCIERYKSFQPCWNITEGEGRFSCARNVLKFGPVVSEEVKKCQGKVGAEQATCKQELIESTLYMIAFRFYDLETRAENLGNRGADLSVIADFETAIELKKQEFYAAQNNAARRQIILDVRQAWLEFVNKVKNQVK